MAKILLVEDDNNLREIYEARLMAEGYTIVSAPDGEAALAVASKEKPDLVISDVMMPNISGFDMLDIMRNTPETANIKVIMLTALSQAEDEARAQALGADRYLVKSQVTLEDIVNNAKVLLGDAPATGAPTTAPTPVATPAPVVTETPVATEPEKPDTVVTPTAPAPADTPSAESESLAKEEQAIQSQIDSFANQAADPATKSNDALLSDAVNTLEASVPAAEQSTVAPTPTPAAVATPAPVAPTVIAPTPPTPANSVAPKPEDIAL